MSRDLLDLHTDDSVHFDSPSEGSSHCFGKNQRSRSKLMEGKDSIQCKGINQKNKQRCRNAAIMEYLGPRPEYCAEHIDCDPNSLYTKCSATYEKKNKGLKKCKEVVLKEFGRCYKHFDGFLNQFSTRDMYDNLKLSYERIFSLLLEHEKQTAQAKLTNLDLYQRKNKLTPKYQEMKNQALEKLNELSREYGFPVIKDESPKQDPESPPAESKKRKRPLSTSSPESLSSSPSSFWGEETLLKKPSSTFGPHSRFSSKKAFPLSSVLQHPQTEKQDYTTLLACPSHSHHHQYYHHHYPLIDRPPSQQIPSQLFRPPKYGERLRIPDNMTLSLLGRRYLHPLEQPRPLPHCQRVCASLAVKKEGFSREKILISPRGPPGFLSHIKKEIKQETPEDLVSIDRLSENLEVPLSQYMMNLTSVLSSLPPDPVSSSVHLKSSSDSLNSSPLSSSSPSPSSPAPSTSSSPNPSSAPSPSTSSPSSPRPIPSSVDELFDSEDFSPSLASDYEVAEPLDGEDSDFNISFDDYPAFSFAVDS